MQRKGFPVVLSAASGTGKTTLARLLLEADPKLVLSLSTTTRSPRGDEQDGMHYNFVDEKTFRDMIARDAFIEWAEVHGHLYGSSREWTEETLATERNVLFDIDVQGGEQIRKLFPESCLVFLVPPTMGILEERLRGRGTDDDDTIRRRLIRARDEIAEGLDCYDYVLTNAVLDRALFDLTSIVRAHRLRSLNRDKIRERLLGENSE